MNKKLIKKKKEIPGCLRQCVAFCLGFPTEQVPEFAGDCVREQANNITRFLRPMHLSFSLVHYRWVDIRISLIAHTWDLCAKGMPVILIGRAAGTLEAHAVVLLYGDIIYSPNDLLIAAPYDDYVYVGFFQYNPDINYLDWLNKLD